MILDCPASRTMGQTNKPVLLTWVFFIAVENRRQLVVPEVSQYSFHYINIYFFVNSFAFLQTQGFWDRDYVSMYIFNDQYNVSEWMLQNCINWHVWFYELVNNSKRMTQVSEVSEGFSEQKMSKGLGFCPRWSIQPLLYLALTESNWKPWKALMEPLSQDLEGRKLQVYLETSSFKHQAGDEFPTDFPFTLNSKVVKNLEPDTG